MFSADVLAPFWKELPVFSPHLLTTGGDHIRGSRAGVRLLSCLRTLTTTKERRKINVAKKKPCWLTLACFPKTQHDLKPHYPYRSQGGLWSSLIYSLIRNDPPKSYSQIFLLYLQQNIEKHHVDHRGRMLYSGRTLLRVSTSHRGYAAEVWEFQSGAPSTGFLWIKLLVWVWAFTCFCLS